MRFSAFLLSLVAGLLAIACATKPAQTPATAAPAPIPAAKPGYYKDDGPGENVPSNLDTIPDARPRLEPLSRSANRPYTVFGREYVPATSLRPYKERGIASWYGRKFHGEKTSIGEIYDMYAMTAAHPTLPLPSYARVTNVATGKSVVVRVNDRGPFLHDRVIDLSYAAAHRIGTAQKGSGEVEVEAIIPGESVIASVTPLPPVASMRHSGRAGSRWAARGFRYAHPGGAVGWRLRRSARRVRELRECAEFRRASREPTRAARSRKQDSAGERIVSCVCRSLSDTRGGEADRGQVARCAGAHLDHRDSLARQSSDLNDRRLR